MAPSSDPVSDARPPVTEVVHGHGSIDPNQSTDEHHSTAGLRPTPDPGPAADQAYRLLGGRRVLVLGGAGISTDSGIPDYRGPGSPTRRPMSYDEFVSAPGAQQRYWARSHLGWATMSAARPNAGHRALVQMQSSGTVSTIITQNVDGLHEAAGSTDVIDLHGRLSRVMCLRCGERTPRTVLEQRLEELNPEFSTLVQGAVAPDGDMVLRPDQVSGFRLAPCLVCGGPLKPDVVFFGENVPPARVKACYDLVAQSEAMLVAGSSLTVMSGLRFVRRARRQGLPVVVVNRGPTRGDDLADLKIDAGCSEFLTDLARIAAGRTRSRRT